MATFLLADDSKLLRKTLRIILEGAGHQVIAEAENGIDCYVEYREKRPDVVTMDMNMPIMDGLETLQKLVLSYPEIKIIMVSSNNNQERIVRSLKAGARYYLVKPLNQESVLEAVNMVLEKKPKHFFNE